MTRNRTSCLNLQQSMRKDEAVQVLRHTERLYKSRPLTKDYTKMLRILGLVQKSAANCKVGYNMTLFVLQACLVELLRGFADETFFTVSALDPPSKPGFMSLLSTPYIL